MHKIKAAAIQIQFAQSIVEIFDEEYKEKTDEYENFLQDCQSKQVKFLDEQFPPQPTSLSRNFKNQKKSGWKQFIWKRAQDIFPNGLQIFQGKIEPGDIKQGKLGDCYFLSALSVLAENENLVKRLFHTPELNQNGIYCVWLNVHGEWSSIVLDDHFPCLKDGTPAFSRANGPELWVLLLEKAYAKVYGSFENIEGGNPAVALRDLTGAPYENQDDGSAQELWDYCFNNYKKGYLLTTYTKNTAETEEENQLGILSGHAYAILQMEIVKDNNGVTCNIIKIRNPWGKVEWKGEWSDQSTKWTNPVKQFVNLENKDDGIFWISMEDFRKYFEGVGVSKIDNKYLYNSIQCELIQFGPLHTSIINIDIHGPTHVYFSLNQIDDRYFQDKIEDYQYAYSRIILIEMISETKLKYICGEFKQDRNIVIEANLEKGRYFILVDLQFLQKGAEKFATLSSYASNRIGMKRTEMLDYHQLLKFALIDNINQNVGKNKYREVSYMQQHKIDITKRVGIIDGLLFFYYQNNSRFFLREVEVLSTMEGYQPLPPLSQLDKFEVQVSPEKQCILLFTQSKSSTGRLAYAYQSQSAFKPQKDPDLPIYDIDDLNITDLKLMGRHKLNQTQYHYQKKEIFKKEEIIEVLDIEKRITLFFDDCLREVWAFFIIIVLGLQLIIDLLILLERIDYLQITCNLMLLLFLKLEIQEKKHYRSLAYAQLLIMLFSFSDFFVPLINLSTFTKILIGFNLITQFLLYIVCIKCLIHFNNITGFIYNDFKRILQTIFRQ